MISGKSLSGRIKFYVVWLVNGWISNNGRNGVLCKAKVKK